jgi:hypothetical protein
VGRAPEKTRFFISNKPHYENSSTNIMTGQEKKLFNSQDSSFNNQENVSTE